MLKEFTIIAGVTKQNGIGIDGKLPWKNSADMKYFKNITSQCINNNKRNAVIMGRNTFKSFNYIPLPNRLNICITSMNPDTAYSFFMGKDSPMLISHKSLDFGFFSINYPSSVIRSSQSDPNIIFFSSLDNALKFLYNSNDIENIFVIGGSIIYKEAIDRKDCSELIINEIDCNVECDTFFPLIDEKKYKLITSNNIGNGVCNNRYIRRFNRSNTI
jgi:dihydrofolate reductase